VSIASANSIPATERLIWTARYVLGGLAACGLALGFSLSPAQARAPGSTWGSSPITISLIESARQERPIMGLEPSQARVRNERPQMLALPLPKPLPVEVADLVASVRPEGGSLVLTPVAYSTSANP
jgi:hypothetical protein